jgi:hypothetical protein
MNSSVSPMQRSRDRRVLLHSPRGNGLPATPVRVIEPNLRAIIVDHLENATAA